MPDTNQTNVAEFTENTDEVIRERANTSDKNTIAMLSDIIRAYHAIGLLSDGERDEVDALDSDSKKLTFLKNKVPRLTPELKRDFCDAFVGDDLESFHGATPAILAEAYRAAYVKAQQDEGQKDRLQKIAARIDSLSVEFANSGGMLIDGKVVDTTNAADVYEGFADMLNARMGDINKFEGPDRGSQITAKKREMAALGVALNDTQVATCHNNLNMLEGSITEYDDMWGLSQITENNASKLEKRWDKLFEKLARAEVFDETKEIISKYKFLDADGKEIPQYKRHGRRIIKEGRLYTIMELARHNVLRRHVGKFDERINADALEEEFNDEVLFLLYNMKNYGQLADAATDDPELFMDYTKRDKIINELAQDGGDISDVSYNAMLNAHTNATGGWLARVKGKVGDAAQKEDKKEEMDRFFEKAGTINGVGARNEKRLTLFKRILKGFLSAFVASAIITGIATMAAATAGMSMAAALAMTGIITALGISLVQIFRWKKAQEAAHQPATWEEFKKDKQLLTSLGVSGLAAVAMAFGAAGVPEAAMMLGFGALTLGGYKNAHEAYKDARRSMSAPRAAVWAVTNALAVVGGGIMGRMAAHGLINMYNESHPTNEILQQRVNDTEPREVQGMRDVTDYRDELTADAARHAQETMDSWYRDNPELYQQRYEMVQQYLNEHNLDIDPNRILLAHAEAGGRTADNILLHSNNSLTDPNIHDVYSHARHGVMTDAWGEPRGFSAHDLSVARHTFDNGGISDAGMEQLLKLEPHIYANGEIGYVVPGTPTNADAFHTDHYLRENEPRGFTTYTEGDPAYEQVPYTHQEPYTYTENVPVTHHVPVDEGVNVAAYGNYNQQKPVEELHDRVGSFIDKIRKHGTELEPTPIPEPEPEPRPEPVPVDDQKLLGPGRDDRLLGPGHKDEDEQLLLDQGHKVDEQLLLGPGRDDRLLGPGHKDENEQLLLDQGHKVDEQLLLGPGRDDRLLIEPVLQEEVERVLGVTRPQAHDWVKWHKQLEDVEAKLAKSPKSPAAAKLQRDKKTLEQNIAHLRNQLGGASDAEIERGVEVALKREEQRKCMDELEKLRAKPKSNNESRFDRAARERKEQELTDKFQSLYKELAKYDIYYPFPIEGVQARKQSEREANIVNDEIVENIEPVTEMADEEIIEDIEPVAEVQPEPVADDVDWSKYQSPFIFEHDGNENERPVNTVSGLDIESVLKKPEENIEEKPEPVPELEPEQPAKTNDLRTAVEEAYGKLITVHDEGRKYFVPAELERLADEGTLTQEPIGLYKGLPINLVDLNQNGNPIAESNDGPVVIVDINGIRVPFVLATGMDATNPVAPGKWYPVSNVFGDGRFYNPSHRMEYRIYADEEQKGETHVTEYGRLMEIAGLLNDVIGDVRNWEDTERTRQYDWESIEIKRQYSEDDPNRKKFVGGCDVMPNVDIAGVIHTLGTNTYFWQGSRYDNHYVYSSSTTSASRDKALVYHALKELETPEWHKENYTILGRLKRGAKRVVAYVQETTDRAEQSFYNLFGISKDGPTQG